MDSYSFATAELTPLQAIGQDIFYFKPDEPTVANVGPSLIVLSTWLGGATTSRIMKYVKGYLHFYPSSAILLIATRIIEILALPFSVLRRRLIPARDIMFHYMTVKTQRPSSILWHIFSHGGCNTAIQLALSIQYDAYGKQSPFYLHRHIGGIILDCCPGDATFGNAYKAVTFSLPQSTLAQAIGRPILYPTIGIITCLQIVGLMRSIKDMRTQLNDPALFGSSTRRLYLYSKADQIVNWNDVQAHIKDARSKLKAAIIGIPFDKSPHCALVRDHADYYWEAIRLFWDGSNLETVNNTSITSLL